MSASEEDVPGVIQSLLRTESAGPAMPTLVRPTTNLYISTTGKIDFQPFDIVISCTPELLPLGSQWSGKPQHYLHLKTRTGKLGSRDLRSELPRLFDFFATIPSDISSKILVCCPTGKDLSVGTALAILCSFADDEGRIDTRKRRDGAALGKAFIKQRLTWISTSNPALNPNRATLQSVNAVLLESQDPKVKMKTATNQQDDITPDHTQTPSTAEPVQQRSEPNQILHTEEDSGPNTAPSSEDMPSTIFHRLATSPSNSWTFTRTLRSVLPTHPSGTVTGTATFTPCALPEPSPPTLLYAEEGEFVTDSGLRFTARRKYVYQLRREGGEGAEEKEESWEIVQKPPSHGNEHVNDGEDTQNTSTSKSDSTSHIAVHFFDDEKAAAARSGIAEGVGSAGEAIGGLFVEMGPLALDDDGVLLAENREQHLCAEDLYTARWRFGRRMGSLVSDDDDNAGQLGQEEVEEMWWEVRYDVKGPKKDYTSTTRYVKRR